MPLCYMCIGFIPFFPIRHLGNNDLSPLLSVIITIYITTVIFCLYDKNTIFRDYHMINLSSPIPNLQYYIVHHMVTIRKM